MTQALYGPTGLYLDGSGDLYIADTLDMVVREVQGNFVALDFTTPVRQGSTTSPQSQTVENDGNASLDLTTIVPATNAAVDSALTDSCTDSETLAQNADCIVGAIFAPATTPALTVSTVETPSIDVGEDTQPTVAAPNAPLNIELVAIAEPITSTTTTVTSSPNPSGFGQNVTFTVTVTTGTGTLTGTGAVRHLRRTTTRSDCLRSPRATRRPWPPSPPPRSRSDSTPLPRPTRQHQRSDALDEHLRAALIQTVD